MSDRFTVTPHGALWLVTDTTTGAQYVHLTEQSAQMATREDVVTGITPIEPVPTQGD